MEGREGRDYFNLCMFVQLLRGARRGVEGSKIPHKLVLVSPSYWVDLEGKGGE